MNTRLLIFFVLFSPIAICSAEETEIQGSYFALIVSDLDGSSSWYQAVLGLPQNFDQEREKNMAATIRKRSESRCLAGT
jgi:hypothetical protein